DYLSLKHKDVLNAKNALGQEARKYNNAGAIFCFAQIFHKLHVQLIFLGLLVAWMSGSEIREGICINDINSWALLGYVFIINNSDNTYMIFFIQ
ncbi:MAG: hypothetical protein KAJ63_01195, partial [Methyloprofundus sp.]|nr:hypothetical protein [Methyloprofundus sp.]